MKKCWRNSIIFSEQLIHLIDEFAKRIGVVIDWTNDNIMPYLSDLITRYGQFHLAINSEVDCVITHDAPSRVVGQLGFAPHNIDDTDIMRFYRFLDFIAARLKFQCWYFGHFHKDVSLEAYSKEFVGVYNEVRPIVNNYCLTLDELITSFTKG